jgi:hypothetical protein
MPIHAGRRARRAEHGRVVAIGSELVRLERGASRCIRYSCFWFGNGIEKGWIDGREG